MSGPVPASDTPARRPGWGPADAAVPGEADSIPDLIEPGEKTPRQSAALDDDSDDADDEYEEAPAPEEVLEITISGPTEADHAAEAAPLARSAVSGEVPHSEVLNSTEHVVVAGAFRAPPAAAAPAETEPKIIINGPEAQSAATAEVQRQIAAAEGQRRRPPPATTGVSSTARWAIGSLTVMALGLGVALTRRSDRIPAPQEVASPAAPVRPTVAAAAPAAAPPVQPAAPPVQTAAPPVQTATPQVQTAAAPAQAAAPQVQPAAVPEQQPAPAQPQPVLPAAQVTLASVVPTPQATPPSPAAPTPPPQAALPLQAAPPLPAAPAPPHQAVAPPPMAPAAPAVAATPPLDPARARRAAVHARVAEVRPHRPVTPAPPPIEPEVQALPPTPVPELTGDMLRRAMLRAEPDLASCIREGWGSDVSLGVTVTPTGEVRSAEVLGPLGSSPTGQCLVQRLQKMRFPASLSGKSKPFFWPYHIPSPGFSKR